MDSVSELEFKVQILARCIGSALGLGRPTRIEIHYCSPQNPEERQPAVEAASPSDSQPASLAAEWATGSHVNAA